MKKQHCYICGKEEFCLTVLGERVCTFCTLAAITEKVKEHKLLAMHPEAVAQDIDMSAKLAEAQDLYEKDMSPEHKEE